MFVQKNDNKGLKDVQMYPDLYLDSSAKNETLWYASSCFFLSFLAPSAPRNLVAFNVSSTRLNITWNMPFRFNGILTQYTVYYKLVEDDNNQAVTGDSPLLKTVPTNETTQILDSLGKFC